MSKYVPVPVEAARQIAHQYEKDVVVIVAHDGVHGQIHTTTYGKDELDKIRAAELGPILAEAAGGFTPAAKSFEDFRNAAQSATKFDVLHTAARTILVDIDKFYRGEWPVIPNASIEELRKVVAG